MGIRSAERVTVYALRGVAELFLDKTTNNAYTPTNAVADYNCAMIDASAGEEITLERSESFTRLSYGDLGAPEGIISATVCDDGIRLKLSDTPLAHTAFILGGTRYALKITDGKRGFTNAENGIYCLFPLRERAGDFFGRR
ncbi:MAG: hypothetical protein IJX67_12110 [Oscillospiraceae bacterium]|nr:hypothetical protein [Oscillospiraceae bacterium]